MKRRVLLRLSLGLLSGLAILAGGVSVEAANRCKDRCDERYRIRKDVCRSIPLKYERKSCERAAKRAKDDCKHRCR